MDALTETVGHLRATYGLRTPEQLSEDTFAIVDGLRGAIDKLHSLRKEIDVLRGRVGDTVPTNEDEQNWKRCLVDACQGQIAQLDAALAAFGEVPA